jgi:hypothetical protein
MYIKREITQIMNTQLKTTFAAAAGLVLAASSASAATLLSYTFDGVDNSTAITDGAWVGSDGFKTDGTTTGQDKHVFLAMPSTVTSGVYTLTVNFTGPGWGPADPNEQFIGMGFSTSLLNQNGNLSNIGDGQTPQDSFGRIEVKSDGRYNAKAIGTSSISEGDAGDPASIGQTVSVVLDTTNVADYTVSYFWGATQLGSTTSIGVQAIDQIYLTVERPTTNTDDSYFSSVSLTGPAAVPEPSSTALLGLGGLALILRRRR